MAFINLETRDVGNQTDDAFETAAHNVRVFIQSS